MEQRLASCSDLLVADPSPQAWETCFEDADPGRDPELLLEIGCGKGQFIVRKAFTDPDNNYIAIEGQETVILRALEKTRAATGHAVINDKIAVAEETSELPNLKFACAFVNEMEEFFREGQLTGIYLNFSDPWPKARHAKRRLTYRTRLADYAWALRDGEFIEIKTDNDGLFAFTLEEIEAVNEETPGLLEITELTRDLHSSEYESKQYMTEYEEKFNDTGKNINYVKVLIHKNDAKQENKVGEYILARGNGRRIPKEDKIFGISSRAKAAIAEKGRENVINGTIGALLDDEGELVVLDSVDKVFHQLDPKDFAEYAPIGGTQPFREAVKKAAFGGHVPAGYLEAVATPGGTGSLRNVISNYSDYGDQVLTSDWHWAPYNTIAAEIGRSIATYEMFDADGNFNVAAFREKSAALLTQQESLVIILNTPAHNPTGYSLTVSDWDKVIDALCEEAKCGKAIALLVDVAYIDFAGDEDAYRQFFDLFGRLPENVLPVVAYSLSKTCTLYGGRCGAMICIAKTQEIADEFKRVCEFSSRGSWSNSAKFSQVILSRIYSDPALLEKVNEERAQYRNMLLARGRAFSEAAKACGLEIVPYDAGFFVSVPCEDPDGVSALLEKEDVFLVPLAKGLRIAVASVPEDKCRILPPMIKKALENIG